MADYTFEIGAQKRTVDVRCLWCGDNLEDGREESGYTGVGPDWGSPVDFGHVAGPERKYGTSLDYGCNNSPDTNDDGTGSHTPNVLVTWDAHLIVLDPQPDAVLDAIIPLTTDDWETTLPVPAGLLPRPTAVPA